jgi:hypothetical protein
LKAAVEQYISVRRELAHTAPTTLAGLSAEARYLNDRTDAGSDFTIFSAEDHVAFFASLDLSLTRMLLAAQTPMVLS